MKKQTDIVLKLKRVQKPCSHMFPFTCGKIGSGTLISKKLVAKGPVRKSNMNKWKKVILIKTIK